MTRMSNIVVFLSSRLIFVLKRYTLIPCLTGYDRTRTVPDKQNFSGFFRNLKKNMVLLGPEQ